MSLTEPAPAKINLTLHVTGRRSDGYHLLDSLVIFTETGDVLSARPAPHLTLDIEGPEAAGLPSGRDNLVWRAATMMGAESLSLTLQKNLPLASGIGGGSADAAACLRLLSRATGKPLPDVAALAALGADVPVCLTPRFTRMSGIGEQLEPLGSRPPFWLVLVNPRVEVSTPRVFRALSVAENPPMPRQLPDWPDAIALFDWLRRQRNDLEAPACALAPEISHVLKTLGATTGCALARMSGSGATCFGLYAGQAEAEQAARDLSIAQPYWWVRATSPLPDQESRATT